jgi:hypothetical protein
MRGFKDCIEFVSFAVRSVHCRAYWCWYIIWFGFDGGEVIMIAVATM